jgi:large repetitive protein
MTNKIYTIAVEVANEPTAVVSLNAARTSAQGPLKLTAKSGALYQLTEAATGFAPQQIQVRRKGKDLHISLEQNHPDRPDLIIENYFGVENAVVVGQAENGQHYPFIPDTARDIHAIDKLADGATITQVLGGQVGPIPVPAAVAAIPPAAVTEAGAAVGVFALNPLLLGGVAAAAAAGAGGGGGGAGGTTPTTPTVQIAVFDDNGQVGANEQATVPVSGTASNAAGGTIEVVITDKNGQEVARKTVPVNADGTWSTTVDVSAAPQGALTAKAVATDTAGAKSSEASKGATKDTYIDPNPIDPNVDPNRPAGQADWTAGLDPASDTGTKGDGSTANNRPTLSGTGEPGGKVEITLPDGTTVTANVNPDGTWSAPYPNTAPALPNGMLNLPLKATDPSGNTQSSNLPVTIVGPTVDIQVFDGATTNPANLVNAAEQTTVTLSGTTTNATAGSVVTIVVSGPAGTPVTATATVQADGSWSTTADLSALPQGALTASATVATTVEGIALTSRPDTQTSTKDTAIDPNPIGPSDPSDPNAPSGNNDWTAKIDPASDTGPDGDGITANNRPTFSGTGEPGGKVEITLPGTTIKATATVNPDGTWSAPYPTAAPALPNGGPQNLPVTVTDPAGNTQTGSLPVTIVGPTVDIQVFEGSVTSPANFITAPEQTSVTLSGTSTNAPAGSVVTIVVSGPSGTPVTATTTVQADGTWSTTADLSALPQGALTASATVATLVEGIAITSQPDTQGSTKDTVIDSNPVAPSDPNDPNAPKGNDDWTARIDPASDTGNKGDGSTANNRPTLSGTGEPGGKVEITLPDGTTVTANVNPDGTWSAPYPAAAPALPNGGPQNLPIKVTDPAGNTQTGTLPVTIADPTVDIQVFDGSLTNPANLINAAEQGSITLSGTTTNANAGDVVTIVVSGASGTPVTVTATVQANGTWTTMVDVATLPDGQLTASATVAVPVDGNTITSLADTQSSTKDTAIDPNPIDPSDPSDPNAPSGNNDWTAKIDPASDTGIKGDGATVVNRPTFSGTGEPGGKVEITLPDGTTVTANVSPTGTWTAPYPAAAPALPNGANNLPVKVTDPAGNTQSGTLPVAINGPTVDIQVFDGSVTSPANFITGPEQTSVTLSGTSTLTAAGDIVTIVVSGASGTPVTVTATVQAGGTWSTTADLSALPQGALTASATVVTTVEGIAITSQPDTQGSTKDTVIDSNPVAPSDPNDPNAPKGNDDWTARIDPASDTGAKGDGSTANNRPTLSGTGEPGGKVDITLPDGTTVTATVGTDGTWSAPYPVSAPALPNGGPQNLPVTVTDPAGNTQSGNLPITITGPTVDIQVFDGALTTPAGFVNAAEQSSVTLSGTSTNAPAGSVVTIVVGGATGTPVTASATVAADGSWTTTADLSALPQGTLTASATVATTVEGITITSRPDTQTSAKDSYIDPNPVDTNPDPSRPAGQADWTAKLDPSSNTGSKDDSITANNRPTFSGTGEPGGKVDITLPDGTKVSTTVNPDSTWSIPYPPTATVLPNGALNLPLTVTDPAGNTQTGTLPVTIVGPAVDIVVFDGSLTNPTGFINAAEQSNITLSGTTTNANTGDIVRISITGVSGTPLTVSATVLAGGTWSTTANVSTLPDGKLTASATVTTTVEGAALTSSPDTQDSSKDTFIDADPTTIGGSNNPTGSNDWTAIIAPASDTGTKGDGTTANNRPTFSGTGEPGGTVEITLPGGVTITATVSPDGTWTAPYPATAPAMENGGPQIVQVKVTDPAGNTRTGDLPVTIVGPTVDIQVFDGTVTSPANFITGAEQANVTLSGTSTNTVAGNIVTIVISGTTGAPLVVSTTVNASGNWTIAADLTTLPQGTLTARAIVATTVEGLLIASRPDSQNSTKDTVIDSNPIAPSNPSDPNAPTGNDDWTARIDPASDTDPDGDGITANNRPTLSGTGEPGGKVEITLPDGTTVTANVSPTGTWTAPYPATAPSLPNGNNDLPVKVTDSAGNTQSGTLSVSIVGPTVDIQVFDGSVASPAGFINAAEQGSVTLSGTTTNAAVGDTVTITVSGTSGTPATFTAQVQTGGTWTTTADLTAFPQGTLTASATVRTTIDGQTITSQPDTQSSVKDTIAHTVVITQNFSALNGAATIAGSKADSTLNIAEAKDGVTYTLTFDTAVDTLTAADLQIIGGGTVRGTPTANAAKTVWTVVVDPTPANTGTLDLRLSSAKLATLADAAGNPAAVTNAAVVSHDTVAPVVTFTDPNGLNTGLSTDLALDGQAIFVLNGGESATNYTIGLNKAVAADTITQVTFEGLGSVSLTNQNTATLNQAPLAALAQGFYSLEVRAVDDAGNTSVSRQIIGKNTGGFTSFGFVSALGAGNTMTGNDDDNFFINRSGVHEQITLGGGSDFDTVFFLKTGLGVVGAADQATIFDFNIGNDKLRLDDLFSGSAAHNQIRFEGVDLDSNGTLESTRMFINTTGGLTGTGAALANSAEQIVTLLNVAAPTQNLSDPNALIARPDWLIL